MAVRTTQNMSPAGTTHYLYDLKGHLLVEADSTGQTLREYVWIDDLPLAVVADVNTASSNLYYVHADQVNRPLKMTNGSEAVVWNATYRPFGEIVSITGPASNNLRFPGQYFLIEDGLHYNWYRHYDPTLGRYLQADPIRDAVRENSSSLRQLPPIIASLASNLAKAMSPIEIPQSSRYLPIVPLEFWNNSSIYSYVSSSPIETLDENGLEQSRITKLTPQRTPAGPQLCFVPGGGGGGSGYSICPLMPGIQQFNFCLYRCPNGAIRRLDIGPLGCQPFVIGPGGGIGL
jgi:RHS repeat-associated protein